ncbi:MAG: cytochrome P450, partial [Microbacteriaceae bacterium]|nr:cytochrome P450 [Microbacteriaceae bacterium]
MDAPTAPGPRGDLLLGLFREMRRDHLGLFARVAREYGDVVRMRLGPELLHLVVHPEAIREVLQEKQANFPKTKFNRRIECFFGLGLLTASGDRWRAHRRMIQPAFQRERLNGFVAVAIDETSRMLERWRNREKPREPVDLAVEARKLTLEIIGKTMFGTSMIADATEIDRAFETALSYLTHRLSAPIPLPTFLPTRQNRRLKRALAVLDPLVYRVIAERRASAETQGDLLSMMLAVRDEETGTGLTDREIRDEIVTMLLAGYDSPSTALAWTWSLLAQHPEIRGRVEAEARSVLKDAQPTPDLLSALPYTTMVMQEGLRLAAPAGNIGREAIEDDVIGGFRIPAGSTVVMNAWVTHRHPGVWPEPEAFNPWRFSPEAQASRPRCAYLPFGEGPRKCIGANLHLMQAPLILAMVAREVRMKLVPNHPL